LSICVATYNRAPTLRRCLAALRAVPWPFPHEVRVCDNASTDDTPAVFRTSAAGDPAWHYVRNERNIGARDNVRRSTEGAAGEFLLVVGDDDYFRPTAGEPLARILDTARRSGCLAALVTPALGPAYAAPGGRVFDPPFAWLRHVGINVPAFVTAVIWRADAWRSLPFEDLPRETVSLPQLPCFIEACLRGPVLGSSADLVEVTHYQRTDTAAYHFYPRHAPVDCFEYPALYRRVLASGKTDWWTRLLIRARRLALLRHVARKMLFMRYNEAYYRPTLAQFRAHHGGTLYWPVLLAYAAVVFKTPVGGLLARRLYRGHPPLTGDPRAHLY
jgi:glycosyltransferase involved in cell wall biosynthesis